MYGKGVGLVMLMGALVYLAPTSARGADGAFAAPSLGASGTEFRYDSEIERAWFGAGAALERRAVQARRRALELGANNLEPAARALIASVDPVRDVEKRQLAVKLAPDLPIAHMALAAAYWQEGDYRDWLSEVLASLSAIPRHLEASVWLMGSLLLMLSVVMVCGAAIFILSVGVAEFTRAAHDLGDLISSSMPGFARVALLCAVVGLPLVFGEGLFGLLLGIFSIGALYGGPRHRAVLAMAAGLFMLGLYPVLHLAGTALDALEADPVATASLAIVRGNPTPAQMQLLREAELQGDDLAVRVLAVRAIQTGEFEQARERLIDLFEEKPADPLILTNLGNMAFRAGRNAEAIEYYERGRAVEESAVLMFDLSQAYARAFRMEEFELTLQRAQMLDGNIVRELSAFGDTDFVADIAFPISPIRARMIAAADGQDFVHAAVSLIAPGYLGRSPMYVAGGFALVFFVGALLTNRYQHAGGCSRCGRRICARCDDSMWSADLCDGCHHLFSRPQGADPQLRMARLQALRKREGRIDRLATTVSVLVPGAAGLLAKRPDLSLVSILFFAAAVVLLSWREGVVPDPLAVGNTGPLAFVIAGGVMVLLYSGVVLSGILIRRSQ